MAFGFKTGGRKRGTPNRIGGAASHRMRKIPNLAVMPAFRDGDLPPMPTNLRQMLPRDALIYTMRFYMGQALLELQKNDAADMEVVTKWFRKTSEIAAELAPYCHAKLVADQIHESTAVQHEHSLDLSCLTDTELEFMSAIRRKLDAAAGRLEGQAAG
jgi:hypothetical protein